MRVIQAKMLPLVMLLGCATPPGEPVAAVASAKAPVSNDSVSPDACFGMRTGAVVLTLARSDGHVTVRSTDLSADELSSVGRCLSAYAIAHPPGDATRVLFRHRTGSSPEMVAPAPEGSARSLAETP